MEFNIAINGEEVKAAMSAYTLVLYEQEFGGADMVADVNGRLSASDLLPGDEYVFDFSTVPWAKLMRAAWAAVKTADESVPHYEKWARGVQEANIADLRVSIGEAMADAFFHPAAEDVEADG